MRYTISESKYVVVNSTKYDTWFGWIALPVMKLLQKIDLIDKEVLL